MLKRNEHDVTIAARLCEHANGDSGLEPGRDEVLCGPSPIEGFTFPVDGKYPLVVKGGFCDLAEWLLFVNDAYIGGLKDGHILKISTEKLLPWYEEAISRYALPDGWSIRDWVFTTPGGNTFPYVPGIEIDLNAEHTPRIANSVMDRFENARGRINYYAKLALDSATETVQDAIPDTIADTEAMMYDMIVPAGLVDSAFQSVYGSGTNRNGKTERQALVAWLANKLQVPVPVFDNVFTFPQQGE